MKEPVSITGLSDIIDKYDAFFLDQFGVLHDGQRPYPDVVATLEKLHDANKKIIILTNSGKRSQPNLQRLIKMGFPELVISHVISSGEVAWRGIKVGSFGLPFVSGKNAFIIGKDGDDYNLGDLNLKFVNVPQEADFLLIMGSNSPETSLAEYHTMLASAAQKNIPALCANPDKMMITSSGLQPAPGAIAEVYSKLGGKVRFIGKPFADIYKLALVTSNDIEISRVIAVGDSVEHDIIGAANVGIASVLVRTGVSASCFAEELRGVFARENVWPNFVIPRFKW